MVSRENAKPNDLLLNLLGVIIPLISTVGVNGKIAFLEKVDSLLNQLSYGTDGIASLELSLPITPLAHMNWTWTF